MYHQEKVTDLYGGRCKQRGGCNRDVSSSSLLTCMLGEVMRLQRLPLAELLAAPVAAEPTGGALAGAVLGAGFVAGRAVSVPVRHGAVPLEQHVRGPQRRAARTAAAPHGGAVRQAVSSGSSPRGAQHAGAERADKRRHDAAATVGLMNNV